MKILFLGEPNSPNTISWIEGLRHQGCEVFLASARTDGSDGNIPVGNPKFPPRMRILTGAESLRRIIREIKPDILLAYRITSYGYLAARTGFHPLVLAAQNEQIVYLPKPSRIRRFALERFACYAVKRADLIHSWGDNITNGLLKYGADRNKILTLHKGIDIDAFRVERSRKFDPDLPVFVSTRSLYPEYLIDKVIEAFALLVRKIPGAKLEIAGGGSEEEKLKAKVKSLEMEGEISFHGRLSNPDLVDLLKSSDIYVSIIRTEGVSSSMIESVACSLLPIVADMPASRPFVDDGVNGLFVRDISSETVCSAMTKAVGSYANMRPALVQNSNRIKDAFNRERNQRVFVEKYETLVESYKIRPAFISNFRRFNLRRWFLNIAYRLSWLFPRISKGRKFSGQRILAVWDLCNLPLSVGDLLHAQAYSSALCEYHNADQVDIAVITEAPDSVLAMRGLNNINFHTYFAVMYPIVFVNKYLGNIMVWHSRSDFCRYVAENREKYIVNMPYTNGEINVVRWVDHFKYLKWYYNKTGKIPELLSQKSDFLWACKFISDKTGGKMVVSIQLRRNINDPKRNSVISEWFKFFKTCQKKHSEAIFINVCARDEIPDGISDFSNVVSAKDYGTNIAQDLAIIQACALHMGSNSGPATMVQLSNKPYAIYSYSATVEDLPDGNSMPWKLPCQILDPQQETCDKLMKDFEELAANVNINEWKNKIEEFAKEAEKALPRMKNDGSIFSGGMGGGQ